MDTAQTDQSDSQVYGVDYFIRKFSAIPEAKWTTGIFRNQFGARCALGHCGVKEGDDQNLVSEAAALHRIAWDGKNKISIVGVNDGYHPKYQQVTAKERILALLRDIKAAQTA